MHTYLSLALLAAFSLAAAPARADGVVIARATDQRGGVWVGCGGRHSVGWVAYELVSVIEGDSPGPRFVGIHSCPSDFEPLYDELRLTLSSKRPGWTKRVGTPRTPADLPAFFVIRVRPEAPEATRKAKRWLGMRRAEVEAELPRGNERDGRIGYGPDLAFVYLDDRVVAVHARVAVGMTCEQAAEWIGYVAGKGRRRPLRRRSVCEWPARSAKRRLDPGRGGRREKDWFDLWLTDSAGAPLAR